MEIEITKFFNQCAPMDYSASVAEIGNSAGADTWRAANADSLDFMMLDSEAKLDCFYSYVNGFGAWSEEEISAWSVTESNALFIQLISGDMRECGISADSDSSAWSNYEIRALEGNCPSNIFRADDGKIYYYMGN